MEVMEKIDQNEVAKPYKPEDMDKLLEEANKLSQSFDGLSISKLFKTALMGGEIDLPDMDEFTSTVVATILKMGNSITYLQADVARLNKLVKELREG